MKKSEGFEIEFYENEDGISDVWNFLESLRLKSKKSKSARIQYKQISLYIELLKLNGSTLPENIMKNIVEDIWELRPGNNRVFYFYYNQNGKYVILHHFRKKSQKTPKKEIETAKRKRNDYKSKH